MTAAREVHLDGERHRPDAIGTSLLTTVVLCNDAALTGEAVVGDPAEAALLVAVANGGADVDALRAAHPRIAEVPFDSANKFMATFYAENGAVRAHVKGAPDVLLALCAHLVTDQGVVSLDAQRRRDLQEQVAALAARGLRVLGAATALLDGAEREEGELADRLTDLTLLGLVGLADPPRPEARDAVALCRRAGVAVKMVTGDHSATAAAIAAEIGIGGEVVTGADLDRMPPDELAQRIDGIGVFARVAPEHKVAIVRALTARGHVVAMTGDGVNDAAA
ncbi:MAG TPA: HAD family hydrolase, partial [Mycobacteriales bacterium]|nr:HAD family hydrolase [Mycobacteriales bacterium]